MIDSSNNMSLPKGKTCNDCIHINRCNWLIARKGNETECDWYPSKFNEIQLERNEK